MSNLVEALEPFARLEIPAKPEGNAGFYSIRLADIERAQAALKVHALAMSDASPTAPDNAASIALTGRLIAAAPELLEALTDLVDWLHDNQRNIEGEFLMDDLLEAPRAAIAKARGEPQP